MYESYACVPSKRIWPADKHGTTAPQCNADQPKQEPEALLLAHLLYAYHLFSTTTEVSVATRNVTEQLSASLITRQVPPRGLRHLTYACSTIYETALSTVTSFANVTRLQSGEVLTT